MVISNNIGSIFRLYQKYLAIFQQGSKRGYEYLSSAQIVHQDF